MGKLAPLKCIQASVPPAFCDRKLVEHKDPPLDEPHLSQLRTLWSSPKSRGRGCGVNPFAMIFHIIRVVCRKAPKRAGCWLNYAGTGHSGSSAVNLTSANQEMVASWRPASCTVVRDKRSPTGQSLCQVGLCLKGK